jgi:hypothetical protein
MNDIRNAERKGESSDVLSANSNGDVQMSVEDDSRSTQQSPSKAQDSANNSEPSYSRGCSIDVYFEASKLPLDVAIFNSARATGGDEKIRKYLQSILVIGGSALIPGMAHALESRFDFFHFAFCIFHPLTTSFPSESADCKRLLLH